ncbi:MAG: hypothetical protein EOM77_03245 [Bacteroidia bacterium]|nr:hypothetical protein [Bacteroidia bacterium]
MNMLFRTLAIFSTFIIELSSCSPISEYSITNIDWTFSYYSKSEALTQINVGTTYVLKLDIVFEDETNGNVSYEDLSIEYDGSQLEIRNPSDINEANHFRLFVTGKSAVDDAHIKVSIGNQFHEDIYIDIVDNVIESEVLSTINNGISEFETMEVIPSLNDFENMVSQYPSIDDYVESSTFVSTFFTTSMLVMFNFNFNVSDVTHNYKFAFSDNDYIYFDFDVMMSEDPSFELKQCFYVISLSKDFADKNFNVYKSYQ